MSSAKATPGGSRPDARCVLARKYPKAGKEWGWQYVFPASNLSVDPRSGKVRRHHVSDTAIQNVIKAAVRQAGIAKHASVHTLRHCFATHLLMNGVNIVGKYRSCWDTNTLKPR